VNREAVIINSFNIYKDELKNQTRTFLLVHGVGTAILLLCQIFCWAISTQWKRLWSFEWYIQQPKTW